MCANLGQMDEFRTWYLEGWQDAVHGIITYLQEHPAELPLEDAPNVTKQNNSGRNGTASLGDNKATVHVASGNVLST